MNQQIEHSPDDVISSLVDWAEQKDAIRVVLLTSTRAVPNAPMDVLSDYDIVLVVEDIHPFHADRTWLADFGEVLVAYWDPIHPDPDHGAEKFGNVTQYADGLKIDFTLLPIKWIQLIVQSQKLPAELDAGFRILLDKDRLAEGMPSPTYTAYIPTQPTDEMYQTAVNDFFSDPPYVAKCLLRNELFPAKWCLDYDMKHVYLRQMLEWKIGTDHNWSVPVGALGKGLRKRLPPELWSKVENAYAGAGIQENWNALFRTMELYRQVAMEVGERLGYRYPLDLDQRVTEYVQGMRKERTGYEGY